MWLHICIFVMLGAVLAGWRFGWIPSEELSDRKGRRMFLMLAAAGNLLGMILTIQDMDRAIGPDYRLEKREDFYEEELMVSMNGADTVSLSSFDSDIPCSCTVLIIPAELTGEGDIGCAIRTSKFLLWMLVSCDTCS